MGNDEIKVSMPKIITSNHFYSWGASTWGNELQCYNQEDLVPVWIPGVQPLTQISTRCSGLSKIGYNPNCLRVFPVAILSFVIVKPPGLLNLAILLELKNTLKIQADFSFMLCQILRMVIFKKESFNSIPW